MFTIQQEVVFEPLQLMMGVVGRRQSVPILAHILLKAHQGQLMMVGSDQELELKATLPIGVESIDGEITLPGRKLFDICRNIAAGAVLEVKSSGHLALVSSERFHSQLKGLPADNFPLLETRGADLEIMLPGAEFRRLISRVEFAMAQQDVRYFFNGLLLEFAGNKLNAVATNGQRLARSEMLVDSDNVGHIQAIVPRKAVAEILKLTRQDTDFRLSVTKEHLKLDSNGVCLTTKLIDAVFPDYQRAIPKNGDKRLLVNRSELRDALVRMAIVSNELYKNVRLRLGPGQLQLSTHNPLREEAEEELAVVYEGDSLEIGFNVNYLIEILGVMEGEQIEIQLSDPGSAALLRNPADPTAEYVISPMVI